MNDLVKQTVKCCLSLVGKDWLGAISDGIDVVSAVIETNFRDSMLCRQIRNWCAAELNSEEDREIVAVAVEICVDYFAVQSSTFSAEKDAQKLTEVYLSRYDLQFEEATYEMLRQYVPSVLKNAICELQKEPNYQNQVNELLRSIVDDHENRITKLETTAKKSSSGVKPQNGIYKGKWELPLFLDEDVCLEDVYQLPHYIPKRNSDEKCDLDEQLNCILSEQEQKMLVVLGLPGIGKTSLITYILNKCSTQKTVRVYPLTALEKVNWATSHDKIPEQILREIGLTATDLSNSVLILDGLDEVNLSSNHEAFLTALYSNWTFNADISNFSLIVTCRRNRIKNPNQIRSDCITLCPLDKEQIDTFAEEYFSAKGLLDEEREQRKQELQTALRQKKELKEVLGIPIILYMTLYMTLALNVPIGDCQGLEDLYHRIFSTTNRDSIYWRGYNNNNAVNETSIQRIHDFSKAVAVTMWDKNPSEATVRRDTAEKLAQAQGQTLTHLLTGQYFIEGKEGTELLFVHRSMYEYFTALSLFDAIQAVCNEVDCAENMGRRFQQANEGMPPDCLTKLANVLGIRNLNEFPDIKAYLHQMLERVKKDEQKKQSKPASWWTSLLDNFLEHGLLPSVKGRAKGGERGLEEEGYRFVNLLWLVKEQFRILEEPAPYRISGRLSQSAFWNLPHGRLDLREVDLREVNLRGTNLSEADLYKADLRGANLCRVELRRADLHRVDLRGADLREADLRGANLYRANLYRANLCGTKAYPDTSRDAYGFTRGQLAEVQWFEPQTNTIITDRTYITAILDHHRHSRFLFPSKHEPRND